MLVHQEHRSSSQRTSGMEPLLIYAPRADVVALLTPSIADWLRDELGPVAPEIVVMPNPLPQGFAPRSLLDGKLIVAAGRLVMEKQFTKLVHAFGDVADELPGLAAADLRPGPPAAAPGPGDPQARAVGPRRAARHARPTCAASGPRPASARSARAPRAIPLVLQEAMAAGVPCVSFDCASGPREIVQHEVNGLLVAPESIAGLSAALLRLGTDDALRHRLGTAALHTSRQWDADALAERWVGIFADARARRAGRARFAFRVDRAAAAKTPPRTGGRADRHHARPRPGTRRCARRRRGGREGDRRVAGRSRRTRPASRSSCCRWRPAARSSRHSRAGDVPAYLSLRDPEANGWHERRGPVAELATDLLRGRTSVVALEPWPIDGMRGNRVSHSLVGQGCTVEVEFWEADVEGHLVAPRLNRYAQRLPRGAADGDDRRRGRHRSGRCR